MVKKNCDIMLILPPFYSINSPPVQLGIIKALLTDCGFKVNILYANLFFYRLIPDRLSNKLDSFFSLYRIIEFVFASDAFPQCTEKHRQYEKKTTRTGDPIHIDISELRLKTKDYLENIKIMINGNKPKIVLIYSYMNQVTSSIAIANYIKQDLPGTIITMGGYGCLKPMGQAILEVVSSVDYIFQGELEKAFVHFCCNMLRNGKLPEKTTIPCPTIKNINTLPYPDFSDYFEQMCYLLIRPAGISIETSRGCWWEKKQGCIFCGFRTPYRKKNRKRIDEELKHQVNKYSSPIINCKDLIMPKEIPDTTFPSPYPGEKPILFYEIKPLTSFKELQKMKSNGLVTCQAGIESLNTKLLSIMNKGITVPDNIRFLRDCRTLNIHVLWNFLYDIPCEDEEDYITMQKNIPLLFHLNPPKDIRPLVIQRYSPLFNKSKKYNVKKMKPLPTYKTIFPDNADLDNLSLFFEGSYNKALNNNELKNEIFSLLGEWRERYNKNAKLLLEDCGDGRYKLIDTRWKKEAVRILNRKHNKLLNILKDITIKKRIEKYADKKNALEEYKQLLDWGCIYSADEMNVSLVCL